MEALGINLGYLLVQILNFGILITVLSAWVYKPVLGLLEKRREAVAQGLEDARIAAEARANAEKEAQGILAEAQQEANQRLREATERAEEAANEVRAEAEKEAAGIREAANVEAESAKVQALSELRGQVAALALAAAQKVIGETLDEQRQHALITSFFSGIESGKVVVLGDEKISGASAEVTSALPLSSDEQQTVEKELLGKMGSDASIRFRVDPSILGGVIIRVGDKVLDGSVAGKLEGLRESLQ